MAASFKSAVSSMIVTTFPAPTPMAGVPDIYPALTLLCEPVTTTKSANCISFCVFSLEGGLGTICTSSAGKPSLAIAS